MPTYRVREHSKRANYCKEVKELRKVKPKKAERRAIYKSTASDLQEVFCRAVLYAGASPSRHVVRAALSVSVSFSLCL